MASHANSFHSCLPSVVDSKDDHGKFNTCSLEPAWNTSTTPPLWSQYDCRVLEIFIHSRLWLASSETRCEAACGMVHNVAVHHIKITRNGRPQRNFNLEAVSKPFGHAFGATGKPPAAVGTIKPARPMPPQARPKETSGSPLACDPGGLASSEGHPHRSVAKLRTSSFDPKRRWPGLAGCPQLGGDCSAS